MSDWRVVTPSTELVIDLATVRDDHLRAANGSLEDAYIESCLKAATAMAKREMRRSLQVETLAAYFDAFPTGTDEFLLPRPPVIDITSITYLDGAGDTQTYDADGYALRENGRYTNVMGRISLTSGSSWPTALSVRRAVTVTYRAGYVGVGSPEEAEVPDDIKQGLLLVVGELYKQRSLSVHAMNQNPSILTARSIWAGYQVYGEA